MEKNRNYLECIPQKSENIGWSADENGAVTLETENKGFFKFLTQKLLNKPKISYIHLDETGSFVWQMIDGEKEISEIAEAVGKQFGEKANPLYKRIAEFFRILESYGFVSLKTKEKN